MAEIWGERVKGRPAGRRIWALVLVAAATLMIASAGCTVAPPVGGSATLPNGTGSISIDQGEVGQTGFCLPRLFALSYVAQDTPTTFTLTITASPSLCEKVDAVAAIYAMPKGATNLGNAFPQKLAERTPFTIEGPGVTTITFHKGCLPAQFDVVTGETPPEIYPGGPYHGPMLFPFPWAAGSAGLWFGGDCGGGTGCESYTPTNLAVKPSTAAPGDTITVSGSGTPDTTVTIAFRQPPGQPIPTGVTVKVPANGQWSVPVTVPANLTPGTWQVVAGVEGCEVETTADITVSSKAEPPVNPPTNPPTDVGGVTQTPPAVSGETTAQPLPPAAVEGTTATNSTGAGLAYTGSSVRLPVMAAVVLLVAGTLLVLQRRRRRA